MSKILLPQLISMLASSSGKSKKQAEAFLKAFFATLSDGLAAHDSIKIKGIGTFKVNRIEARKSVNVSTGEDVQIPPHFRVTFKPADSLALKVNKEFSWLDVVELSDKVSNEEIDSVNPDKHGEEIEEAEERIPKVSEIIELDIPVVPKPVSLKETSPEVVSGFIEETKPEVEPQPEVVAQSSVEPKNQLKEETSASSEHETQDEPLPEIPEVSEPEVTETPEPEIQFESEPETLEEPEPEATETPEREMAIEPEEHAATETDVPGHETETVQITAPIVMVHDHPANNQSARHSSWTFAAPEMITEREERQSERLGEELEEDFGMPEPSEPLGPLDPQDPEPGQPIPEDTAERMPEFDPYAQIQESGQNEKEEKIPASGLSQEEKENLVTKADLRPLLRNLKKVRKSVDEAELRSIKRSRNTLIWSLVICTVLITGGFFLFYFLMSNRFVKIEREAVEKVEQTQQQGSGDDDEYAPTTVSGISSANKGKGGAADKSGVKQAQNPPMAKATTESAAPTTPSDIKAMDKVTKTRNITSMAREYYGNFYFWPYIYIENESKLGHPHPDRIKPGTSIVIPDIAKYDVDPNNPKDVEKAKKLGVDIIKKFATN